MFKHFEHVGMGTTDMDACLAFYVDLLGLKLIVRKSSPGGRGEVAFVDAGGAMLEIGASPDIVKAKARRVPNTEAGVRHLTFTFENIDETYARLLAAGVTGIEPPRDAYHRDMLARVAFVEDPDGIVVELSQR